MAGHGTYAPSAPPRSVPAWRGSKGRSSPTNSSSLLTTCSSKDIMIKPTFKPQFLVGVAAFVVALLLTRGRAVNDTFGFCFSDLECTKNAAQIKGDIGTDKLFYDTCYSFRPAILDGKVCKTQSCEQCYPVVGPKGLNNCMPHGGRTDPKWWCYSFH